MSDTRYRLIDRTGGVSRRDLLRASALTGVAVAASSLPAPFVHAAEPITIRYAGTGVNAFRELSEKCKADTGITIQYTTLTSDDVVKRAVTQPTSFDLLDSEYWMLKKIIPSGNLRGMDTKRVKLYDKIVPIFTKGELPDGQKTSRIGIAPIKVSYLQGATSKEFSETPTDSITLIPTVYNADTLGIRPDLEPARPGGRRAVSGITTASVGPDLPGSVGPASVTGTREPLGNAGPENQSDPAENDGARR